MSTATSASGACPLRRQGRDQDRPVARSAAHLPRHARHDGHDRVLRLLDVAKLKEGDTVVVSGAAGAVGSVAGQIAKIKGARVIGIAGGEEKCRWLVEDLGFDAAIDYKTQDVRRALREHAPDRVDVYFDNVGGDILDAVLTRLARGARIVICGAVSQYNATEGVRGPANYLSLLVARASMTGMVVFDYAARFGQAAGEIAGWMREGRLISREDVVEGGVSAFPDALLKLFAGENIGKLVLRVGSGLARSRRYGGGAPSIRPRSPRKPRRSASGGRRAGSSRPGSALGLGTRLIVQSAMFWRHRRARRGPLPAGSSRPCSGGARCHWAGEADA